MEYKLLWNSHARSLSDEVNEHIKLGWKLYKAPFGTREVLYQAMTKEDTRDELDFPG